MIFEIGMPCDTISFDLVCRYKITCIIRFCFSSGT